MKAKLIKTTENKYKIWFSDFSFGYRLEDKYSYMYWKNQKKVEDKDCFVILATMSLDNSLNKKQIFS